MPKQEQCTNCGAAANVVREDHRFDEIGLPVVLRQIEVVKCPGCGNVDPILQNLNHVMQTLALAVICDPCSLNGREFRFLRKYVGLGAEEFGKLLHLDKTSVSKMENGHTAIGKQTDRLVRFVVLALTPELKANADQLIKLLPEDLKTRFIQKPLNLDVLYTLIQELLPLGGYCP